MITVEHLTKCYGDFLAVDDLSFEIEEGHVYGFLGPNGAGKSTTMNIITGCLSATSGRVRIDGHDIFEEPGAAKRLIGYLPEQPPLYLNETPVEYLRFVGEAKGLRGKELEAQIGDKFAAQLRSDVELVEGVYDDFDRGAYLRGELAPVFFGSAVNNFGVRELLECFVRIAPSPRPAPTATRTVEPAEPKMTGFVFKIHANMDPNHRDRIAFLKICSGTFERNHNYLHVRSGKQLKFSSPTAFMAEKKSVIDFAYPGDIVGLHDTGNFKIGDTFTEGEKLKFTGIPSFAPEQFRYIENADPLKFKQLAKGVDQLMDEGVAQLFVSSLNGRKIIGTVGALQFEVIQYRLEHEYNAACRWEPISIYKACWIESDNAEQLADFKRRKHTNMAVDKHGRDVFLADTSYGLALAQENFKDIRFHFTSEF